MMRNVIALLTPASASLMQASAVIQAKQAKTKHPDGMQAGCPW